MTEFNDVLDYIDFAQMCEDFKLESGDISLEQTLNLEAILKAFVIQNLNINAL